MGSFGMIRLWMNYIIIGSVSRRCSGKYQ